MSGESSPPPSSPGYRACRPLNLRLWQAKKLTVKFRNTHLLKEWNISADTILMWAGKWRYRSNDVNNYIPEFVPFREYQAPDIIIDLNGS